MPDVSSSSSCSSASSSSSGLIQSPFALIEAVEAAILTVSNMQSYMLGDRRVTYADLGDLMRMRAQLKSEVAVDQQVRPYVAEANFGGNF